MGYEQKRCKQLAVHDLKKGRTMHHPLAFPSVWNVDVKARFGNRQFSLEMKAECWRCKTESEEPGLGAVRLPSQICTSYAQTISWERNKLLPLLNHSYFDFWYNNQICFLTNTGIHFYTICVNEHLSLKETNNLSKTAYGAVPLKSSDTMPSLSVPLWYGNASEIMQLYLHAKAMPKPEWRVRSGTSAWLSSRGAFSVKLHPGSLTTSEAGLVVRFKYRIWKVSKS